MTEVVQPFGGDIDNFVTSVSGTAPIASTGGTTPVISLNNTAVTPGSYTSTNLTVDAQGRITAATNGTGGGGTPVGSSGDVQFNASGAFGADTGNFFWDSTNHRLGIGITAPSVPLEIHTAYAYDGSDHTALLLSNSSDFMLRFLPSGSTVGSGSGAKIILGNGIRPAFMDFNNFLSMGTDNNSDFVWTTNNNGAGGFVERMRIKNSGNVGIGVTSPAFKLDLNGGLVRFKNLVANAIGPRIILDNTAGYGEGAVDFYTISGSDPSVNLPSARWHIVDDGNYSANMLFETKTTGGPGGGMNTRLAVLSSGNVGIGTVTPGSKLSIVGLPTSASGLSAGDIWNNGGVLNIV